MKGFENLSSEVAKDLIELVNNIKGLEKSSKVEYSVQNKKGEWSKKSFSYVPLDSILNKIKENNNFALLQPIGIDDNGINGVKCILIHKTGHIFETNTYPFRDNESTKIQDEGAEITYRKRYSVGAFLGMATEEDTNGNDPEASNSEERKATPKQIEILLRTYKDDNLTKLLELNKLSKIEDITMRKASELIQKNIEKSKQKKEEKNENEKQNDNERI
jgi:hypothetical protein